MTSSSTTSAPGTARRSTAPTASSARLVRWPATRPLFGGPATVDNPIDEPGTFSLTSDLLPPEQFPQFAGTVVLDYLGAAGAIEAIEGEFAVVANHADESYMRLGRTFDLTGVTAAAGPDVRGPARVVGRAGLRPPHRGGPHGRAGELDHAARPQREHQQRRPGGLRGGLLPRAPPEPAQVPDARQPVHDAGLGDAGALELVHR